MVILHKTENPDEYNHRSMKTLARAIKLSQGEFSLILVCCNSICQRQQATKQLQLLCEVKLEEFNLAKTANTLFSTILDSTQEQAQPQALIVSGLESVENLELLLRSTNIVRNQFSKQLPFPLILWVTDETQQQLMRLAPDFYSWAAATIKFRRMRSPLSEPQPLRIANG